ncbi:MAG: hypothetical protein ACK5PS_08440 [Desulfopila sp.]
MRNPGYALKGEDGDQPWFEVIGTRRCPDKVSQAGREQKKDILQEEQGGRRMDHAKRGIAEDKRKRGSEVEPEVCRFFASDSSREIPFAWIVHELEDLRPGRVVEVCDPEGKKTFYNIEKLDDGPVPRVYLVRARNNTWRLVLLLALLTVSWYVIRYIIDLF